MNLYEIALPLFSNDELLDYKFALAEWEHLALRRCGGFTRFPAAHGVWRTMENDQPTTYEDRMVPYRVACAPEQMRLLVADAFRFFPDQLAFFVSQIGTAEIVSRGETYGYGK